MTGDRINRNSVGNEPAGTVGGPQSDVQRRVDAIALSAQRMAEVVNESMRIAQDSKHIETRRARIRVARDMVERLEGLAAQYPFLKLQRLAAVWESITGIDRETDTLECQEIAPTGNPSEGIFLGETPQAPQNSQPIQRERSWHIGNPDALHPYEVDPDHPAADGIVGMEFIATLQLRTPLRILRRDGQVLPLGSELPSDFERWMGIWVPKTKTFREMGLDLDEFPPSTRASTAGLVDPSEYLPFLIALREIIESDTLPIIDRIAAVERVCARPEFARYLAPEGGAKGICISYFPPLLSLIPGLPKAAQAALRAMNLDTVAKLREASDATLLGIKGIGPAKLAAIRACCGSYNGDPAEQRLAKVKR